MSSSTDRTMMGLQAESTTSPPDRNQANSFVIFVFADTFVIVVLDMIATSFFGGNDH